MRQGASLHLPGFQKSRQKGSLAAPCLFPTPIHQPQTFATPMKPQPQRAAELALDWAHNPRWIGIQRPYSPQDVVKLQGSVHIEYSLARQGAERLWELLHSREYVAGLGALTGNQAVQEVQAGLQAIYLNGGQVAADANGAGHMYPDQSLYPVDSVPAVVRRINNALLRADQIQHLSGEGHVHWLAPIVADAEAGFGGNLNAFELMKMMIE